MGGLIDDEMFGVFVVVGLVDMIVGVFCNCCEGVVDCVLLIFMVVF